MEWDENTEITIILPPDFPGQDLMEIASRLEQADILVPGYTPGMAGLYKIEHYLYETRIEETSFIVLPDRNLSSRMAQLSKGESVDERRQRAAELMAFCQCLNLNYEPSVSYHELAYRHGNDVASEELRWYRAADVARPLEWVNLAMGRTQRLAPADNVPEPEPHDLAYPLRRWRRNYILALRIAELELQDKPQVEKALELLDWMFSDFFLAGPASMFANVYFAPAAPKKGMLKQLRSANRDAALEGAKNAAWDITYLSEFTRFIQEATGTKKRTLLATSDRALARTAKLLVTDFAEGEDQVGAISRGLSSVWPHRDAIQIAERFTGYQARLHEDGRQVKRDVAPSFIDDLTRELEARVSAWKP